jgi:hypothetical protein
VKIRSIILASFLLIVLFVTGCNSHRDISIEALAQRELNGILESTHNPLYLLIHGAGDTTESWARDLSAHIDALPIDWKELSDENLRAPELGYQMGLAIGQGLLREFRGDGSLHSDRAVRIIAHSAGAWVAQGIVDGSLENSAALKPPIVTELVFLDPFTAKSVFELSAGARMLGIGVPNVRTYFTKIDPVPFTAGKVATGTKIDLSSQIDYGDKKVNAHWRIINVFAQREFPFYREK